MKHPIPPPYHAAVLKLYENQEAAKIAHTCCQARFNRHIAKGHTLRAIWENRRSIQLARTFNAARSAMQEHLKTFFPEIGRDNRNYQFDPVDIAIISNGPEDCNCIGCQLRRQVTGQPGSET